MLIGLLPAYTGSVQIKGQTILNTEPTCVSLIPYLLNHSMYITQL